MKRQEGLRSLACSPTRESWHSGEQSGWGRVETGEATQHVRAEPGLEPKVTWLKAQPFALYPTPLNVGLGGEDSQEQEDPCQVCVFETWAAVWTVWGCHMIEKKSDEGP